MRVFRPLIVFWLLLNIQPCLSLEAAESGVLDAVRFQNSDLNPIPPQDFTNIVSVAKNGGSSGVVALRDNGTLGTWGAYYPNLPPALANVAAIAAGNVQGIALLSNGTLRVWGADPGGVPLKPKLKKIRAIAAGGSVGLALRADGRIVGWGDNSYQQLDIPRKQVRRAAAIACGDAHALALTRKGIVVAWGDNSFSQTSVPTGLIGVKAIAAGGFCSMALLSNGTVVAWGDDRFGQTNVPPGLTNVIAIAVGARHCLALKSDGTAAGWGFTDAIGTPGVPADLAHITAVFATVNESFFITKELVTQLVNFPTSAYVGQPLTFEVRSISRSPVRYQWRRDGMDISGATNSIYYIASASLGHSGSYSVLAQNDFSSRLLTVTPALSVHASTVIVYPTNIAAKVGESVAIFAFVEGVEALSFRWYFNGALIPGGNQGTLFIGVTPTNGGLYHAVARISITSTLTSSPALLTVLPGFSVQPATWFEGDGTNVQYVSLTTPFPFPTNVTMGYSFNGSIHVPPASGSVTIPAGSNNGLIPVTIIGDNIRQPEEKFEVYLGADLNVALWHATMTVLNDDAFPLLNATPHNIPEGNDTNTQTVVTLQLSTPTTNQVSVRFETQNGTGIDGQDYLATNGVVTFAPGQTEAFISVTTIGNLLLTPHKNFELSLTDATNAFFTNAAFTITIGNDDTLQIPPGFTVSQVATGLLAVTAFVALEDRVFVCEQEGRLMEVKDGQQRTILQLDVTTEDFAEAGLLGLAVDPGFEANHFFYVYYTRIGSSFVNNRVSRFTYSTNGTVRDTEQVLLDLHPLAFAQIHNGGGLKFGPDGKLYISVGESGNPTKAQSLTNLFGKILRLNSDGTIPADNPFYSTTTGNNRAIWAYGLRNPWRFDFERGTGRMFINDVGQSTWEEINEGFAGANYGWHLFEGISNRAGLADPFFIYGHSPTQCSITGGAFVGASNSAFPAEFSSSYFFADYCGGFIRRLDQTDLSVHEFVTGLNWPVDLQLGADGSLYCAVRNYSINGGAILRFSKTSP